MASRRAARSDAEPASQPRDADQSDQPLAVARGIGGRIELYPHAIRIVRHGYVNFLLTWLGRRPAFSEIIIAVDEVTSFDMVEPVFFNDFVNIAYPGSPPLSGRSLHDSLSENSLLMNFFDNRAFYALRRRYQMIAGRATVGTYAPSALRRSWRSS